MILPDEATPKPDGIFGKDTLELEPRFVDVALKRWQAFSRKDAIHAETGLTFDEVASERGAVPSAE